MVDTSRMHRWVISYFYGKEFRLAAIYGRNIPKVIETLHRMQYDKSKPIFIEEVRRTGYYHREDNSFLFTK